ncbi:MAG: MASE1 domain-containing protein [Betaproteobacteria bacterium]
MTKAGSGTGEKVLSNEQQVNPGTRSRETLVRLAGIGSLAAIYFLAAKASLLLAIPPGYATTVWPPSGIALAAVLLFGSRVWPGIWLGAAITNLTIQGSPVLALVIGTGNTLEAVVAAGFVHRYIGAHGEFETGRAAVQFVLLSTLSALTAAFIGSASIVLSGAAHASEFDSIVWTWFQGDAAGMMILTPLILAWRLRPLPVLTLAKWIEVAALAFAAVFVSMLVFGDPSEFGDARPLGFVAFPIVLWAATRFEQRGVITTIATISAFVFFYTVQGKGQFAVGAGPATSFYLLCYFGSLVLTGLVLSVFIGQRKRAESIVRQRVTELQENERHVNEFLAMLSHELRNPLAPLVNGLAVLRKERGQDSRMLGILERQVANLSHIVDDLLDVSRITRGKIRLQRNLQDLNDIVVHALDSAKPTIDAKGHAVDLHLSSEKLLVDADATRLSQVTLNLVNNAAKYTPPGGHLTISASREKGQAILKVKDNGIGISAEFLPDVFKLFMQGERGLDRSEGGLGIGLTVAKRIVEMHGGSIAAFSDGPGKGAEFVVRLPAASAPAPADPTPNSVEPPRSVQHRVLVVDDNRDSADSLSMLLKIMGHDVRTVYDGPEAVESVGQFRPDVVLLDIGLPSMSGYDVARVLHDSADRSRMVLIAVTGYGQDEDRRRSREAGFDHHLVKPVNAAALDKLIASFPSLRH